MYNIYEQYHMHTFLIDFLTLGAILSALLVVTSKNPVMSVLFLISLFLHVSGYLVLLGLGLWVFHI